MPITFTVADSRWLVSYDDAAFLRIERANDPRQRITVLANLTPISSADYPSPAAADRESLVIWISGHPDLVVLDGGEVSLGGLSGTRLDLSGTVGNRAEGGGCLERLGCVPLLATTAVPFAVSSFDAVRLYLLDMPGGTIAVAVEARHETPTEDFLPAADSLLRSLIFGT